MIGWVGVRKRHVNQLVYWCDRYTFRWVKRCNKKKRNKKQKSRQSLTYTHTHTYREIESEQESNDLHGNITMRFAIHSRQLHVNCDNIKHVANFEYAISWWQTIIDVDCMYCNSSNDQDRTFNWRLIIQTIWLGSGKYWLKFTASDMWYIVCTIDYEKKKN